MTDKTISLEPLRVTATAVIVWLIPTLYAVFAEGIMLGRVDGMPLTNVLRVMRFDALGRFLLIPFATWLYWHVVLRPLGTPVDRRDFFAVALGLALALVYGKWYPIVNLHN